MDISITDPNTDKIYPELKSIGYNGVDVNFPMWDEIPPEPMNRETAILYYRMAYGIADSIIKQRI